MAFFSYKDGTLYAEDVNLINLAQDICTPFYCYSQQAILDQFLRYKAALRPHDLVAYALKANSHQAILRLLEKNGAGADIVSGGELFRALNAHIDPKKIVYSGVGKTPEEIDFALTQNIKCFNVESVAELAMIQARAKELQKIAPISLRINPDISAASHHKISTGSHATKFGIPLNEASTLYQKISQEDYLAIEGVDIHIGSQICSLEPFKKAFALTQSFVKHLETIGISCQHIDVGGGLGITYQSAIQPPSIEDYVATIFSEFKDFEGQIICEPGRNIVGNAGILVTKLLYIKDNGTKRFLIVDAAMNNLIRPTLYDAYQEIVPLKENKSSHRECVDIVGPVCETGDYLALDRMMPPLQQGEFLAILDSGAYGAAMASQYNSRPFISEIFIKGENISVIRAQKPYQALIQDEAIPIWLA